ncbi:MAG: DUF5018 domain-containing protein [Bacteroidales bacterium]|nr:DUF5018 domain-containing protein [Bacteroidales bacterium]
MKKAFIILSAAILAFATACHSPEFVESTANRQGLTSLTAIFTFGPYVDQEMAKLTITDEEETNLVIPIPYYYPETSDDETSAYVTKVRIKAELQPNWKISPALTVLDLTEDNWFKLTNPQGVETKICITGERVKSSACEITSFVLDSPVVSGVIDKENKIITLPTKDDVTSCTATVQISSHATISPDPTEARDYTNGVEFTVTAHDGTTCTYTVQTGDPEKIDSGINTASIEKLFNIDPVTRLALPDYSTSTPVSLAYSGGVLAICTGSGSPMTVNGLNGSKIGTMTLGSAVAGAITNDAAENILITNIAAGSETVNLYKSASTTATPELFYSFANPADCPVGNKMKVFGDLGGSAVIVMPCAGIDGVTTSSKVVYVTVENGAATGASVCDMTATGMAWGSAPTNIAGVIPASAAPATDGWLLNYYEGGSQTCDQLQYINGAATSATGLFTYNGDSAWGYDANCLDSKEFNGVRYAALLIASHFPAWGMGPQLYFYDITTPSAPSEVFKNTSIGWYQTGSYAGATGDVILAPSADGFKIYVYYYDGNSQAVGGYVGDCIKR